MSNSNFDNVSKTIGKLLELMDNQELVLPEIQRDFVWTKKAIKLLVDSLYRGLPIGHMLVWKAKGMVAAKSFDGRSKRTNTKIETFYGYLLDGQQRLTSLAHLRDNDDEYPLMFYAWPERDSDGDEAFYWRGRNEADNVWCVPITEILSERFSVTDRLNLIKADPEFKSDQEEIIRQDLARVRGILSYPVGVTEFETDTYSLATELFIRFNSTGRKLRRSDLSIAELALHVPGLASKEMRQAQARWKQFRFTLPFLVECLLAVHTGRFRLKDAEQFWPQVDPAEIRNSWRITERAIGKLAYFLSGTVHWSNASLIPSFNALIPLVFVLSRGDAWSVGETRMARSWLLLASLRGYFSGAVESRLDRVLRQIGPHPTVKKLWNVTKRGLRRLTAEDFQTGRLSGPVMSLYLSMLRDSNAKDWKNLDSPLDGTVVGHGATLHVHHFFPKALLHKRSEITRSDINTFANYTLISADTNLNVSTEEPHTYLDRLGAPETELKKQAIPLDQNLWQVKNYQKFLAQRRKSLAQQTNAYLGV